MNRKCHSFMAILCCLLVWQCIAFSQVSQQWVARYDDSAHSGDVASKVLVDNTGNVYVCGTGIGLVTSMDFVIIKYNSFGTQLWFQRYNGSGNGDDNAAAMVIDNSGNIYVTGESLGNGTGYDCVTIKYNSSGNILWEKKYNGPANGNDGARDLKLDPQGNIYVIGYSFGGNTFDDYVTIKYDNSGNEVWVKRFDNPVNGEEVPSSIVLDNSGNVFVTGTSQRVNSSPSFSQFATVKYSQTGVQQWVSYYAGPNANLQTVAKGMAIDPSGNVYVAGTNTYTPDKSVIPVVKYSSNGAQLWAQAYIGPYFNSTSSFNCITTDNSGNVYVGGSGYQRYTVGRFLTVKYSADGIQQWVNREAAYFANSIVVDANYNVYVGGTTNYNDQADMVTVKYDPSGAKQWLQTYNGHANGNDAVHSIAVDNSGSVFVTGESYSGVNGQDFFTIKYSQLTGVNPGSNEIPKSFSLHQNYPNPFNPSTKIKFDIPEAGNAYMRSVQLFVCDALGREVAVLVNESLKPGSYEIEWNSATQPSGVYFYTLNSGDFKDTKKMILIK